MVTQFARVSVRGGEEMGDNAHASRLGGAVGLRLAEREAPWVGCLPLVDRFATQAVSGWRRGEGVWSQSVRPISAAVGATSSGMTIEARSRIRSFRFEMNLPFRSVRAERSGILLRIGIPDR